MPFDPNKAQLRDGQINVGRLIDNIAELSLEHLEDGFQFEDMIPIASLADDVRELVEMIRNHGHDRLAMANLLAGGGMAFFNDNMNTLFQGDEES